MPSENFNNFDSSQTIDIVIPAYNARNVLQKSVGSTLLQELPTSWKRNIIIIDDGSSDGTFQQCRELFKDKVKIYSHERNRGRSSACNTGWRSGSGQYVIFMDADCEWYSPKALISHLKVLESGADISVGPIMSNNHSFWDIYQNMVQSSREKDFASGNLAAFTSANLAIKRSLLESSGGFDEGYRHYGFEDRDFLLRLISRNAKINFCKEAAIAHNPDTSLTDLCGKMIESGQFSSARFQAAHPEHYAHTVYGKIDCRIHGFPLTLFAMIFTHTLPSMARVGNKIVEFPSAPFQIKKIFVKIISGLAYMVGTYRGMKV